MIREVKTKDAGEYMCQVNSVPMVSQVAHLEVVLPPLISDKHSTKDISVAEGGKAKFSAQHRVTPRQELPGREWMGANSLESGSKTRPATTTSKDCEGS